MPSWTFDKAPTWAPNAVATDKGWVDKKTGEILVACKKLTKAVPYDTLFLKGGQPKKKGRGGARPGAGRPKKQEEPKVEEPKQEEPKVETVKPKAKPKKAPAKKRAPAKRKPKKVPVAPKVEVKTDDE